MKPRKRARNAGGGSPPILRNDYTGHVLSPGGEIFKVHLSDLSSERFFREFVAPRKPVLIQGCLPTTSNNLLGAKWTNRYLDEKAGDSEVKVEFRGGAGERFGQGREKAMKFGDFLGELEKKNDLLYLTTQNRYAPSGYSRVYQATQLRTDDVHYRESAGTGPAVLKELGVDLSGRPRLMSAPLDKLKNDFPLRPRLTGALLPQNVNLWMGYSKEGSSSGLHHDFHDNLYVLLRGEKKFRLFSPADAHRMYVEGELVKVHPNGRINYKGQETLADGSDPLSEAAERAAELVDRAALEAEKMASKLTGSLAPGDPCQTTQLAADSRDSQEEVKAAQAALERGEEGAAERLAAAEEELEKALEAVLDAECAGNGGFGDCDSDESSDSEGGPGFFDGINDNPSEEEVFAAPSSGTTKLVRPNGRNEESPPREGDNRRTGNCYHVSCDGEDMKPSANDNNGSDVGENSAALKRKGDGSEQASGEKVATPMMPSNFSKVDPALPREELIERFPLFFEAVSCNVEVEKGQMLFLPAGWFHEVSSIASEDGHMAFNYWFHPPDAGIGSDTDVCDPSAPYTSTFWLREWEAREREAMES